MRVLEVAAHSDPGGKTGHSRKKHRKNHPESRTLSCVLAGRHPLRGFDRPAEYPRSQNQQREYHKDHQRDLEAQRRLCALACYYDDQYDQNRCDDLERRRRPRFRPEYQQNLRQTETVQRYAKDVAEKKRYPDRPADGKPKAAGDHEVFSACAERAVGCHG